MKHSADTNWIADRAKSLGFDGCGVVRAEKFPELERMTQWLADGYSGEMKYLADPRRSDPQSIMPGIQSVIVCLLNYNTPLPLSTDSSARHDDEDPRGWISRYAWGTDYHEVILARLNKLV